MRQARQLIAVFLALTLSPASVLGQEGPGLDRAAQANLTLMERCSRGNEQDCHFIKAEVAVALVALGVVAAPEVVAAVTARLAPRVTATAGASGAAGAAAVGAGARFFTPEETEMLCRFFGRSAEGAKAALQNFQMTPGITRDLLLRYQIVAQTAIDKGKDQLGVQALRLQLIQRALVELASKEAQVLPSQMVPALIPAAAAAQGTQERSFNGKLNHDSPKR